MALLSVGHGTLQQDELVALLRAAEVELVVDVRSYPGSRRHPQFGREAMEGWLPEAGIDYRWERLPDGVLEATVVADAFCHSMVRSLVGAVVPVGEGRRPVGWPASVLRAARRDPGVVVMPPHGLSLEEVVYPEDGQLAARAQQARSVRTLE